MKIRKAKTADLDQIERIYDHIHDFEESGVITTGWIRGVYPIRETAEKALERDDLFVGEDNSRIVATAIINRIQVPEYYDVKWKYEAADEEVMVLHTLIVDPFVSGKGYGKEFVAFYEDYALKNRCHELRIDTNEKNVIARKMYARLGYKEIDIIPCVFNGIPDVGLVCLEKHLTEQDL